MGNSYPAEKRKQKSKRRNKKKKGKQLLILLLFFEKMLVRDVTLRSIMKKGGQNMKKKRYTTGEIASAAGLTVRAIQHYDNIGLLRSAGRTEGGATVLHRKRFDSIGADSII